MTHITIYTKSGCPNCVTAKALLKQHGMEFIEIDASKESVSDLERALGGFRQMPQIFYKGERIGGLAGLQAWIKWKEEKK